MAHETTAVEYYAHTMPGLEWVVGEEIEKRLPGTRILGAKQIPQRNGLLLFTYAGDVHDLLVLRTAEDVFRVAVRQRVSWGFAGLEEIGRAVASDERLIPALEEARGRLRRSPTSTFRAVVRIVGAHQPYRRVDLQRCIEMAIEDRTRRRWRAVTAAEQVELWVNLVGLDLVCGVRLSPPSMRHRDYQEAQLPATLRPSIAASLVWLTRPGRSDVFMDPFCGTGTIMIERALMERYALLVAGDLDMNALAAAATNIGPRHKPRQLFHWDATRLPLAAGSVHAVASNLPFGVQMSTPSRLEPLYRAACREMSRVMVPRGRLALLSGTEAPMGEILRGTAGLRLEKMVRVAVLGRQAIVTTATRL